ncbi:MAG: C-GCAxxG-C-C family protein [Deltaproteobacteria bacterium]
MRTEWREILVPYGALVSAMSLRTGQLETASPAGTVTQEMSMTSKHRPRLPAEQEELVRLVRERAQNLFETGQLLCSEAVVTALNRGLSGGMDDELAIRIVSTLPLGIGESGCTCGALSGGFKELFGSTCCRVLSKKVKAIPKAHVEQCTRLTGTVTELVARALVERDPHLVDRADWTYLRKRESRIGAKLTTLLNLARN